MKAGLMIDGTCKIIFVNDFGIPVKRKQESITIRLA